MAGKETRIYGWVKWPIAKSKHSILKEQGILQQVFDRIYVSLDGTKAIFSWQEDLPNSQSVGHTTTNGKNVRRPKEFKLLSDFIWTGTHAEAHARKRSEILEWEEPPIVGNKPLVILRTSQRLRRSVIEHPYRWASGAAGAAATATAAYFLL